MSIGNKIKEYREENKMTQRDIAEILEVEPGTISKYESGIIEPNIESLKKLAETFNITVDELINDKEKVDVSKINILNVLREQKEMNLKGNLYHNTQIKFAYNTNHIEGSKLTEDQTRCIYETNTILFENETIANEAGTMKTSTPKQTPKDMQNLMEWYNSLTKITIKEIIEFHARFEKIHPFQDGNGRVGRIIAFKECLKNNIIPFIILDKDKLFYYRGLKEYQNKTEKGYLIDTCLNAQDQYISMIEHYLGM